jgi:hypothetical protein
MTRNSLRELAAAIDELTDDTSSDDEQRIVIDETIIGTDWEPSDDRDSDAVDMDAGDTQTEQTVIELGGSA